MRSRIKRDENGEPIDGVKRGEYLAGCSTGMPPDSDDCLSCGEAQWVCECSEEEIELATEEVE